MTPEEVWRRFDAMEARLTAPLSERMLDLAGLEPGMHVLDLATGRGEPAVRAARRVAPGGSVLGVDPAPGMLAMARERAAAEGVTNLELRGGDAAALDEPARFDAGLCRWGLMFMADPRGALAAARRALLPGARFVLAVWAEPERVGWFSLPRRLLARYRPIPPVDHAGPGTFHYADPDPLRRDLEAEGFRVEHSEELEVPVVDVETPAELFLWARAFSLRGLLDAVPEPSQRAWEADLLAALDGHLRLSGVTRVVVAV